MLAYFAKLYKEQLLDPTRDSDNGPIAEKNTAAKVSWLGTTSASVCVEPGYPWRRSERRGTPIPIPKGAKGARQNDYSGFAGSGGGWCIGANCKNPERVIGALDWKLTPIGLDTNSWGIQDTHYTLKGTGLIRSPITPPRIHNSLRRGRALKPEIVEKYKTKADPFRSYQSDTGTGQLDFGFLGDDAVIYTWDAPGEPTPGPRCLPATRACTPR